MVDHLEGNGIQDQMGDDCGICGHPFNPHVLVATLHSPEHGGLIFCPEFGCMCESTWSLEGRELPYIPDAETVAELRAMVQEPDDAEDYDRD